MKTSYNTGPYEVVEVETACRCPAYGAMLDGDDAPSMPHVHLTLKWAGPLYGGVKNKKKFYLNGYDEITLKNVWNEDDYLIRVKP